MRQDEHHQMELERMFMLEEALNRAETGIADQHDWDIIRFECGLPRRGYQAVVNFKQSGESNESNSVR